jgi:phage terminase large subunit
MCFNEATTEAGRSALGWYHDKKDDARGIGLGPEHDWASHGADGFGLGCVVYEEPHAPRKKDPRGHAGAGAWMGAIAWLSIGVSSLSLMLSHLHQMIA